MSVKDGKDYLYLVWKENVTKKQYIIGQLTKNTRMETKLERIARIAKERPKERITGLAGLINKRI